MVCALIFIMEVGVGASEEMTSQEKKSMTQT